MAADYHERRLRELADRPPPAESDLSLAFLRESFKREVERPMKQLGKLSQLWAELVPAELAAHTRLESLSRGVLRVAVDSSPRLYELDRLLRSGLQQQLISRHSGPAVRRVQLRVSDDWVHAETQRRRDAEEGNKSF